MTLAIYLSRFVSIRVLLASAVLIVLGLGIDLLDKTADLIKTGGAMAMAHYAWLRAPGVLATLFPVAVLTGGALSFLTLSNRSEITVLRAAGRSMPGLIRLLVPLMLALGLVYYVLNDRGVSWSERQLSREFPAVIDAPEPGDLFWSREPRQIVRAHLGNSTADRLTEISIFVLDQDGRIVTQVRAKGARFKDRKWVLEDATRLTEDTATHVPEMPWETRLVPRSIRYLANRAQSISTTDARAVLEGHAIAARSMSYYQTQIAHGYAASAMPLVMLIFASLASLGTPRSNLALRRAGIGVVLGFAFMIVDGLFRSFGMIGIMNPLIASVIPTVLFLVIGFWLLIMIEH